MADGQVALSTAKGGRIYVGSGIRDSFSLLDVLYANQFEGESFDPIVFEQTEENFYRGAPPEWLNFHISRLAVLDGTATPFIKRDGCDTLVQQIRQRKKYPGTSTVKMFHQPGCGGTTLAMQVLWDLRKKFRCAVLTGSTSDMMNVAKEVVHLFTAGGRGQPNTVLLLVNDEHILENLQDSIMMTIAEQKINAHMTVAILLSCVRKDAILQSDHVVLKRALSDTEVQKFKEKKTELSRRYSDKCKQFHGFNIMQTNFSQAYVRQACTVFSNARKANRPLKTQLAAFLSLLNAYVPGSYLMESQCLDFLKHDDQIHGDLSMEDRMQPFSHLIITFEQDETSERRVRMAHPMIAQTCTELMAEAGVTRSDTARNLLTCLCGDEVPPYLIGFIKDMLTKRETKEEEGENPARSTEITEMFSRLILKIKKMEGIVQSVSVLKVASTKFNQNPFFPQALARFYYIEVKDYTLAEMWAKRAKQRDPQNSFIADTLGQVHKNHLNHLKYLKNKGFPTSPREILQLARKAIEAFKDEEQLAENEHGTEMKEDGMAKVSNIFNTSGHLGYLKVCETLYDLLVDQNETWRWVLMKNVSMCSVLILLGDNKLYRFNDLINSLRDDVKKKCDFLNAFLTYSKPNVQKEDQSYIKIVSSCYRKYTEHQLPDLVFELVNKFKNDVSLRDVNTPEPYIVALLKQWPMDNQNNLNLMQLIEKMSHSYEASYAKYFRSRTLCPLFYLGKDEAVGKIFPTGLESFLEENEDATLDFINYMESKEKIFRDLRLQGKLLKFHGVVKKYSIFTTVGGMEIMVKANMRDSLWIPRDVSFYLGFNIRGLVAFGIQTTENEPPRSCTTCGSDTDSGKWTTVTPESTTQNYVPTYSLQSEAGQFQCSVSGLRWVCKTRVSFTYQFKSWEKHRQKLDIVHCTPGGPLLNIQVTDGELDELYLPHWICTDGFSTVSDKFAVLHISPVYGNFLEQVSEVTATHVKLFQPNFPTHGVLVRAGFPVKVHCSVLTYQTNKKPITSRVYLIPRDPALQQVVEQKEKINGSSIIQQSNLKRSLKMLDYFILTTDAEIANITPAQIQLRHVCRTPHCFTASIKKADSDFKLTLGCEKEDVCYIQCTVKR